MALNGCGIFGFENASSQAVQINSSASNTQGGAAILCRCQGAELSCPLRNFCFCFDVDGKKIEA